MKTACEEAADYLDVTNELPITSKRLRAEGRKIVRYERLIRRWVNITYPQVEIRQEAVRIQKARVKK